LQKVNFTVNGYLSCENINVHYIKIVVVLEGNTIIDVPSLADGFVILFALIYAFHLAYPKTLVNTFDFIQNVLMGLEDEKLKPKGLSLKNDLLTELYCFWEDFDIV
uniref:Uncharacterized protein n=1 Tax=Oryzias latipes TaxID=8090 RepID=A0A3B3IFV2_ORYLA